MKKKQLNKILVIAVIGIWGIIFYRVYTSYFDDKQVPITIQQAPKITLPAHEFETFTIAADYRDPFLGKSYQPRYSNMNTKMRAKRPITRKKTIKKTEVKKEKSIIWPKIKVKGKMTKKNKTVVLLEINGKIKTLEQSESYNEITVKTIYNDSIEVTYQNESRIIK